MPGILAQIREWATRGRGTTTAEQAEATGAGRCGPRPEVQPLRRFLAAGLRLRAGLERAWRVAASSSAMSLVRRNR